jgi:F-type H+-transporting ATPase subunit b
LHPLGALAPLFPISGRRAFRPAPQAEPAGSPPHAIRRGCLRRGGSFGPGVVDVFKPSGTGVGLEGVGPARTARSCERGAAARNLYAGVDGVRSRFQGRSRRGRRRALIPGPNMQGALSFIRLFASGDINVDFDLTFVAQCVLFTFFVVLLKPLLFDPLMKVFEAREKKTEGAKEEAREMDKRAAELRAQYESEMEKIRREAGREREELRAETAKLEAKIMAEARAESAAILEAGKAKIAAEMAGLRAELSRQTPALAAEIASRVIGREVSQ